MYFTAAVAIRNMGRHCCESMPAVCIPSGGRGEGGGGGKGGSGR